MLIHFLQGEGEAAVIMNCFAHVAQYTSLTQALVASTIQAWGNVIQQGSTTGMCVGGVGYITELHPQLSFSV